MAAHALSSTLASIMITSAMKARVYPGNLSTIHRYFRRSVGGGDALSLGVPLLLGRAEGRHIIVRSFVQCGLAFCVPCIVCHALCGECKPFPSGVDVAGLHESRYMLYILKIESYSSSCYRL